LDALVAYAESGECRHAEVITYYKDAQRITKCGHCDSCLVDSDRRVQKPAFHSKAPKIKTRKRKRDAANHQDLSVDQAERLQALKDWRKAKAKELDLPAFMIFSDKSLRDMAIKNPKSLSSLRNVHGIGDAKLEKFGDELIVAMK
jgi:ATP-dependent DNA helicase RecQ